MKDVERAILTLLGDSGLWLSPNNIAKNTGYTSGYIRKQCKNLVEDGLLEVDSGAGDPFYQITEEGIEYLEDHA